MVILVAHAPGRLPATIRSRCRRLDLRPLSQDLTKKIAMDNGADDKDADLASQLAAGSPGRALSIMASDGTSLWKEVDQLISRGAGAGQAVAHALSRRLALAKAAPQRKLFFELLVLRLEQEIRAGPAGQASESLEPWFALRGRVQSLASDVDRLYLDPAQVVYQAIQDTWRTVSAHPIERHER
jgi:DNA polymerase-3 subunit delta'